MEFHFVKVYTFSFFGFFIFDENSLSNSNFIANRLYLPLSRDFLQSVDLGPVVQNNFGFYWQKGVPSELSESKLTRFDLQNSL